MYFSGLLPYYALIGALCINLHYSIPKTLVIHVRYDYFTLSPSSNS